MMRDLKVSSSPHLRDGASTKNIMQEVCLALIPAGICSIVFFGFSALALIVTCVISCVVSQYLFQRINHQKIMIGDWSAVVTGILLAYNLPANAPLWIAVVGSVIAIVLVKQCFGGIGANFMNPALTARAILFVSWSSIMADYPKTVFMTDTAAGATPLALIPNNTVRLFDLMIGNCAGVLGETCKIAIMIGGIYLLIRKIADWRIPVFFIGTVFLCYVFNGGIQVAFLEIMSGGLMLGAFFMATDYATSPMTHSGRVIMGIGCGVLLFVIRSYAVYPEGCSFAILFMNVMTPMIDRFTVGKIFGEVKKHG